MAKFCTNCGKEIPENVAFCTECGTKVTTSTNTSNVSPLQQRTPKPSPLQQKRQPQPEIQQVHIEQIKPEVVGTGYFFGMMFVYALPVVGWGLCVFNALFEKNKNKRNFARAMFIWLLIGIVLAVLVTILVRAIGNIAVQYFNTEFGAQFSELKDLLDQLKNFTSGESLPFDLSDLSNLSEGIELPIE